MGLAERGEEKAVRVDPSREATVNHCPAERG